MDPCNLVNKTVQPKKFIWMKTFSTFQTMAGKHPEISFLVSTQWLSITDCWKYKLALPWHYIYNSSHWNFQSSQAFRRKQDGTTKCELPSIERLCIHSMLAFKNTIEWPHMVLGTKECLISCQIEPPKIQMSCNCRLLPS